MSVAKGRLDELQENHPPQGPRLRHSLDGAARKPYVLDFLAGKGYYLEDKEVDNAIKAAVLRLHRELEASSGSGEAGP